MTDEQIKIIEQIKTIIFQIEQLTYQQYKLTVKLKETTEK